MKRTEWFQRKFPRIEDNGLMPTIIERLAGTPARLRDKFRNKEPIFGEPEQGKWSIKKEIGHLYDLEPLWATRALNIINGDEHLEVTDLTNQKTFDANHDEQDIEHLINAFAGERNKFLTILTGVSDEDLEKSSIHPRLKTPMRLVDLAYFVAEHDDHHLAQISFLIKGKVY